MKLRNFIATRYPEIATIALLVSLIVCADLAVDVIDTIITQAHPLYTGFKMVILAFMVIVIFVTTPTVIPDLLDFEPFYFSPRAKIIYTIGLIVTTGLFTIAKYNPSMINVNLLTETQQPIMIYYALFDAIYFTLFVAIAIYRINAMKQSHTT